MAKLGWMSYPTGIRFVSSTHAVAVGIDHSFDMREMTFGLCELHLGWKYYIAGLNQKGNDNNSLPANDSVSVVDLSSF